MAAPGTRNRITRDDLEDKFRELEGGAREQAESARSTLVTAGVVAALLLLLLVPSCSARARAASAAPSSRSAGSDHAGRKAPHRPEGSTSSSAGA